ncbi:hypothetical protein [Halanaerobacter jeridensis]|uniref:Uncharacterized protein n=1 Tax=Halanaerobacter jeridensis TaxID=706427 RepID=A0A939BQD7_9FIRM|nr:hypothetical protein [Halanaerobacter jeridensis]MBM7558187.1 hypothetical protein [Halanaerobacter jeridensis]
MENIILIIFFILFLIELFKNRKYKTLITIVSIGLTIISFIILFNQLTYYTQLNRKILIYHIEQTKNKYNLPSSVSEDLSSVYGDKDKLKEIFNVVDNLREPIKNKKSLSYYEFKNLNKRISLICFNYYASFIFNELGHIGDIITIVSSPSSILNANNNPVDIYIGKKEINKIKLNINDKKKIKIKINDENINLNNAILSVLKSEPEESIAKINKTGIIKTNNYGKTKLGGIIEFNNKLYIFKTAIIVSQK